jgi:hypothetical protein
MPLACLQVPSVTICRLRLLCFPTSARFLGLVGVAEVRCVINPLDLRGTSPGANRKRLRERALSCPSGSIQRHLMADRNRRASLSSHLCSHPSGLWTWQHNSKALCNDFGCFQGPRDREPVFAPRLKSTFQHPYFFNAYAFQCHGDPRA